MSRPWLNQIAPQVIGLLDPIDETQFASIRASRVKAMDETPIKAGRGESGKLKAAYFWPVYGEGDEVCFPFFDSRRREHVEQALGSTAVAGGVLLSDGYTAYECYTRKTGLTHAQCWAHTRRKIFEAKDVEPEIAAQGLELIGELYAVEERIREQKFAAAKKRDYRLQHAKPIVERFFAWVEDRFAAQGLLPSNPMTRTLADARERRLGLEGFLTGPDVPIDTNHLERALRAIPMGAQERAVLLDRTGRETGGDPAESDRHLPAARDRSLHVPGRRAAAGGPTSGPPGRGTHAPAVEATLRAESTALPAAYPATVGVGRTARSYRLR